MYIFLLAELSLQSVLELFPESYGAYFPPIRTFKYQSNGQLNNLRKIIDDDMFEFGKTSVLVARNHVIIGWQQRDVIEPLSNLFGETNYVFNTINNKFVRLNPVDLWKLGVGRRLSSVRANDKAAAVRRNSRAITRQAIRHAILLANHPAISQATNKANTEASQVYQDNLRRDGTNSLNE